MAATVVDELVVELSLDTRQYDKADKAIDQKVTKTQKKQDDAAKRDKERARQEKMRNQEREKQIKAMTGTIKEFAGAALAVAGVTATVGGFVGMLAGLAASESAMKRATVATGLSVKEMNAWRTTAQRLTGDAEGGANAIANLAREQTSGRFTGNMPQIAALMSAGVNVQTGASVRDILVAAQARYRAIPESQRPQMEAILGQGGLDPAIINMLRSNQDVGAAFDKSNAESAQMDEKGVDAFNDALASMNNQLRDVATVIMQTITPALQQLGPIISDGVKWLANLSGEVKAAGGGMEGFVAAIDQHSHGLAQALQFLSDAFAVAGGVMKVLIDAISKAYSWINDKLGFLLNKSGVDTGGKGGLTAAKDFLLGAYHALAQDARAGDITSGKQLGAFVNGATANATTGPVGSMKRGAMGSAGDAMNAAIAAGFTPAQAAAIAANMQGESSFKANNPNMAGGGRGAHGLLQWRGPRLAAYEARYGHSPDQGTLAEAMDFIRNDPYERRLVNKAFAGGGTAADLASRFNNIFEGNGSAVAAVQRAGWAQQIMASATGGDTGGPLNDNSVTVNGNVTVVANHPDEFGAAMQKKTGAASNNNSATR